jgi:tRNA threonylcarbamoyladenosine biosynthesis protein TsaE
VTLSPTDSAQSWRCVDPAATESLGAGLAQAFLPATDRAVILFLRGPLGSGKTTLVRGLLRALGITGSIRSPTFSLLEHYPIGALNLLHIDLYRLNSPRDLAGLGLSDFDHPGALWLIEWPEQGGTELPPADLELRLSIAPDGHEITAQAGSPLGNDWLARLDRKPAAT